MNEKVIVQLKRRTIGEIKAYHQGYQAATAPHKERIERLEKALEIISVEWNTPEPRDISAIAQEALNKDNK